MFIKYLVSITSLLFASYSLDCDCNWGQEVRIPQAQDRRGKLLCHTAGQAGTRGLVRKNEGAAARVKTVSKLKAFSCGCCTKGYRDQRPRHPEEAQSYEFISLLPLQDAQRKFTETES